MTPSFALFKRNKASPPSLSGAATSYHEPEEGAYEKDDAVEGMLKDAETTAVKNDNPRLVVNNIENMAILGRLQGNAPRKCWWLGGVQNKVSQ
jgi:hypothetical protein